MLVVSIKLTDLDSRLKLPRPRQTGQKTKTDANINCLLSTYSIYQHTLYITYINITMGHALYSVDQHKRLWHTKTEINSESLMAQDWDQGQDFESQDQDQEFKNQVLRANSSLLAGKLLYPSRIILWFKHFDIWPPPPTSFRLISTLIFKFLLHVLRVLN